MKYLLIASFVVIPFFSKGQKPEYQILFEGIGDNREFFNDYGFPQTILGTRGAFELGYMLDNHRLMGGLSHLFEFGSDISHHMPKLTFYYQFTDERKEFVFGSFPRRGRIQFPLAMLTDTLMYYRPNIEGMYSEVKWKWGRENGFVDWVSRQTDVKREQFMAGFSGEIYHKSIFAENYLLLFHDAGPAIDIPGDHIKDYLGYSILGGVRTTSSPFQGHVKAGVMTSYFRERSVTNGFIKATGLYAEAWGKLKNYSLKSTLHSGAGHKFAFGDNFYRANDYWRTDVTWHFINHKNVKGIFTLSFHVIDWKELNQQQQLSVIYLIGK